MEIRKGSKETEKLKIDLKKIVEEKDAQLARIERQLWREREAWEVKFEKAMEELDVSRAQKANGNRHVDVERSKSYVEIGPSPYRAQQARVKSEPGLIDIGPTINEGRNRHEADHPPRSVATPIRRRSAHLSATGLEFARDVQINDHEACAEFIRKHPTVRNSLGIRGYIDEAVDAFSKGDIESKVFALSCLEKCLILQKPAGFLRRLIERDRDAEEEFKNSFAKLKAYCEDPSDRHVQSAVRGPRSTSSLLEDVAAYRTSTPVVHRGSPIIYETDNVVRRGGGRHGNALEASDRHRRH